MAHRLGVSSLWCHQKLMPEWKNNLKQAGFAPRSGVVSANVKDDVELPEFD